MRLLITLWGALNRAHPFVRALAGGGIMFLAVAWLRRPTPTLDPFWLAASQYLGWFILLLGVYLVLPGAWLLLTLVRTHRSAVRAIREQKAFGKSADAAGSRFTPPETATSDRPRFDT